MALAVWSAFDAFRKGTVDLDPADVECARASRNYLWEQLKRLAANDAGFPRLGGDFIPFGSFARRTKIRPLDDVDVLLVLNGQSTRESQFAPDSDVYFLKIVDRSAPLSLFPDTYDYVDSTKVLNKIRDSLGSLGGYRRAEIHKRKQAVSLALASYDWVFDIVPAVPITGPDGQLRHYLIPNGTGDWTRTDPRIDAANVTKLNEWHGGYALQGIRLLKYWNRKGLPTKPALSSYYLETLALRVFLRAQIMQDIPAYINFFLVNCGNELLAACPDPKGLGPALDVDVAWSVKEKVSEALATAAWHSRTALTLEAESKPQGAIAQWREVFGSEFPTYG
jgi:hypothetical protein